MRKNDLAAVQEQLFQGEPLVMRDSDECWAGIGVCGAYEVFLLAPWNGVVSAEMFQGAGSQCDMAVLVMSGDAGAVSELQPGIPLVAVIDGAISSRTATSLWQADIVVATRSAPESVQEAADLVCDDIGDAAVHIARLIATVQSGPTQAAPAAQEDILEIVPADACQPFDTRQLLDTLCEGNFLPLRGSASLMLGLGQINGHPVAIVASQPANNDGRIGVEDCAAARHLMELAQRLRLPVLSIQDTAGMADGENALPDAVAALLQARAALDMPVFTLVVGRAYGLAHVVLGGASTRPTAMIAWPRAQISLDGPGTDDAPVSIMTAAQGFGVHDVIDPRTTSDAISGLLSLWQV